MTHYKQREITSSLVEALDNMPVVVLTGMRQAGKSTLLQHDTAFKKRRYITLDDFTALEAAKRNPEALLSSEAPLTIDEVQRCPELLVAIKRVVDRERAPGRFLLSGSANFTLLKNVTETLAGRAIYFTLQPFNLREAKGDVRSLPFLLRFIQSPHLPESPDRPIASNEVMLGGMPSVVLGHLSQPALWYKGYEQTYIDRDLRQLAQVADLITFRHLLRLTSFRTGQVLNISELGRDAKLNTPTTSRYLNLMETSFLFQRVSPFLRNRSSRLIKSPKIYASDSGLACHLAGIQELGAQEPLTGALFETFAAQNLASLLSTHSPQSQLMFWNVQGRHEVDFVIETSRTITALEIKAASRWGQSDLSGLKAFLDATPQCQAGILAYNGTEAVRLDKRLWALPLRTVLA
ncbi:MAG: ATP-binding protein [Elusimicrobia bacterium]|nr:ATP-binding protein [Elusimicrobiota bacterium]